MSGEDNSTPAAISSKDKAKIKRLNLKIKHLTEELEQISDLYQEYEDQFNSTINDLRSAIGAEITPKESSIQKNKDINTKIPGLESGEPVDPEEFRHEIDNQSAKAPPWMKKLYKQIAMKTHPDRMSHANLSPYEIAEYHRLFEIAKQAVQDLNGADLVYAAEILGINPEIPADMRISMLASRGEKLKQELQKICQKPCWVWGESHGDNKTRKRIIASYCKAFGLAIPSEEFLDKFLNNLKR